MPTQTRSATRAACAAASTSSRRAQLAQKSQDSNSIPKSTAKPKATSKSRGGPKANPKAKVQVEQEQEPAPARKRPRRSGPKSIPQGNDTLETRLLVNLPVEVLIEIARYVHPLDLIMLSRVNKFLRELFMDKRSALIWSSARENLPGLPGCPDEVSEPQYAAMLFTKRCSTCGGYAPREMNPVLLIRLCAHCWVEELVDVNRVTDSSLVSAIGGPVPGQSRSWKYWCLYSEARAVKIKLNELTEIKDEEALRQWKEERHNLVATKRQNATALTTWLRDRDRERARDRNNLKILRRNEIESRLIKLGWERGDLVCYDQWRNKQWRSMVYTTKTLTDKGHLEINRDQRLEREQRRRRSNRINAIYTWFDLVRDQLPAYARAAPHNGDPSNAEQSLLESTDSWSFSTLANNDRLLRQAFPRVSQAYAWPEYTALVENDMPHEQFLNEFEGKKSGLQDLITSWRHGLEAQLTAALPEDTQPPTFGASPFSVTVRTSGGVQSLNTLPEDTQKLLRADATFIVSPTTIAHSSKPHYYPHSFDNFGGEPAKVVYHHHAHNVSRALLSVLGIPDATYLNMKALGRAFRCGRCPQAMSTNRCWEDIVSHYLVSIRSWEAETQQRQVQTAKNFTYACIHDINVESSDRPLVRMPSQEDLNTSPTLNNWSISKCMLCQSVGLNARIHTQTIVEHVRYVHLIEEPEIAVHYQPT
ncbi:hypothetical protein BN14_03698 [Rhizoctonia solani AG-1 IB]|uniref:F-box domain-containing protein n=2 Tax=Rhizoctonia solani TaxID=456999 RepID=A0A8H3GKR5_9AGAM|nr:unnamed protein product [Rhizoctonia solani]CCO29680.1 hypothetical protein BN14_03698 [Rhizoctonia solani AG-1 IB]